MESTIGGSRMFELLGASKKLHRDPPVSCCLHQVHAPTRQEMNHQNDGTQSPLLSLQCFESHALIPHSVFWSNVHVLRDVIDG